MNRYCKVRLVKSFTCENLIDGVNNRTNPTIHTRTRYNPIINLSTNNGDKINKGVSSLLTPLSAPQKKITRNSVILRSISNKQLPEHKNPIISGQSVFKVKNSKLNKNIENPPTNRQSLEEANPLYHTRKLAAVSEVDVVDRSNENKQTKLKKKRKSHKIIWERKLTGAQRVSKRLSNMRNKNKKTGEIESFNLFPLALLKKKTIKLAIPYKMIEGRKIINKNRKERNKAKEMCIQNERTEKNGIVQQTQSKTPAHRKNVQIEKSKTKIALKNKFVECQTKDYESHKLIEIAQKSVSMESDNIGFSVDEVKCENVSSPYTTEETEASGTAKFTKDVSVILDIELMNLEKEENINENIAENIEIIQEDCLNNPDIIIVELESAESLLVENPKEKTLCENKEDCHAKTQEDNLQNTLIMTDHVQCPSTQTDMNTEQEPNINKTVCAKEQSNASDIQNTNNVPEKIKLDETIQTVSTNDLKN